MRMHAMYTRLPFLSLESRLTVDVPETICSFYKSICVCLHPDATLKIFSMGQFGIRSVSLNANTLLLKKALKHHLPNIGVLLLNPSHNILL